MLLFRLYTEKAISCSHINVSSISGKTTSTELSSFTYKHLCRTVPSDKFLAKAMVDLITHFNWGYVAVVGLDDSYGRSGAWAVASESTLKKGTFCIALTEFIRLESPHLSIPNIVRKLKQIDNVKVVILWLYKNYQTKFFAEVQRQNLTGRVWILSEADLISTLPLKGILESSLRFQLYEFSDSDFKEYLKDISVRERNNGTFPEWNYSASEIWKLLKNKKCVHHRIEQCSNDFIKDIYSSFISCTLDAVYALAHATDISTGNFTSSNTSNRDKSPFANSLGMQTHP